MFKVKGISPAITDFSVQTDVVSHDPSDTSAGVGGVSVALPLHESGIEEDWRFLTGEPTVLDGVVLSTLTEMNLSDTDLLSLSGEMSLRPLQAHVSVQPLRANLQECISHIVRSVLPTATIAFTGVPTTPNVVVPAFYGSVWVLLRDFLNLYRVEVVMDGSTVLFRAMGVAGTVADIAQTTAQTETVSGAKVAEYVEIEYFGNEYVTNGLAYPLSNEDPSVVSVGAGEVATIELRTLSGLSSVNQPPAMDWIAPTFNPEGTTGGYTIAGDDGLPITAAAWTKAGGSVRAEIKDKDPYTIILTVTAPIDGVLAVSDDRNTAAPYHLAMTDGTLYPRLFITGTGVRTNPQMLTIKTGASDETVEPGVGFTLSNPCVGSLSQAYDVGLRVAQAYSGVSLSVSRSAPTYPDYTSLQGSRFTSKDANYRIQSTSYTPTGVSFTAVGKTDFADFNAVWGPRPHKFSDFDSAWAGKRFRDFSVAPLR